MMKTMFNRFHIEEFFLLFSLSCYWQLEHYFKLLMLNFVNGSLALLCKVTSLSTDLSVLVGL